LVIRRKLSVDTEKIWRFALVIQRKISRFGDTAKTLGGYGEKTQGLQGDGECCTIAIHSERRWGMGLLPYRATMEEEGREAERRLREGGWHEVADVVEAMGERLKEQREAIRSLLGMRAVIVEALEEVSEIAGSEG
jgi:hypothetical protein